MSTRCLTIFRSSWNDQPSEVDAIVYRHHDGYPEGHGTYLADFLQSCIVRNGKGVEWNVSKDINGPGRLAAKCITLMWADGHEPSMEGADDECRRGEEFRYVVTTRFGAGQGPHPQHVTVYARDGATGKCTRETFSGSVAEFAHWCEHVPVED